MMQEKTEGRIARTSIKSSVQKAQSLTIWSESSTCRKACGEELRRRGLIMCSDGGLVKPYSERPGPPRGHRRLVVHVDGASASRHGTWVRALASRHATRARRRPGTQRW